jgi:hypothetical protein
MWKEGKDHENGATEVWKERKKKFTIDDHE